MALATPNFAPEQVVAVVGGICAQLVDATLIDGQTSKLIVGIAGLVIPTAWLWASSHQRGKRATLEAVKIASKTKPKGG